MSCPRSCSRPPAATTSPSTSTDSHRVVIDARATPDASIDGPPPIVESCTTSITASGAAELCAVGGSVEHVRLVGVQAPRVHASYQVYVGLDAPPTNPQGGIAADQFKVLFYGGGAPAPAPQIAPTFGSASAAVDGDLSFVNQVSTVCFDPHDSAEGSAPIFVL